MKGKKNPKVQEPVITQEDKQNDPFIRAIAKKVRNITKKTSDIEALQKREDLKPEQIEKINSKQTLLDEKKRFEDFVKFYKSTLVEAANEKETKQVSPLIGKLSNSLVLAHYLGTGAEVKDLQLTGNERKVLTNLASVGKEEAALNDLGKQLSGYFVEYLDNQKLTGKVEEYFTNEKTGGLRVSLYSKPEVHVVRQEREAPKSAQKVAPVEPTPEPVAVAASAKKEVKEEAAPVVQVAEEKQVAAETAPVAESAPKRQEATTVPVDTTTVTAPTEGQTQPKQQGAPQKQHRDRPYKPYNKRPYKPRQPKQGEQGGQHQEGYYRRGRGYYKKYNQRKDRDQQESGEEQEQNLRTTFNNKQMRDLQNDGFIVVQKKQKPKDPKESSAYYRKQHGYKDKKIHDHHNHNN